MPSLFDLGRDLMSSAQDLRISEQVVIEKAATMLATAARKNIGSMLFTPLASSTVSRKGSALQLFETGGLKGSIAVEIGDREAWIGSSMKQAGFLEFGTSRMPARPFLGRTLGTERGKIERMAAATIGKSIFHSPRHEVGSLEWLGEKAKRGAERLHRALEANNKDHELD